MTKKSRPPGSGIAETRTAVAVPTAQAARMTQATTRALDAARAGGRLRIDTVRVNVPAGAQDAAIARAVAWALAARREKKT
mgnify:CR=1 FL=1